MFRGFPLIKGGMSMQIVDKFISNAAVTVENFSKDSAKVAESFNAESSSAYEVATKINADAFMAETQIESLRWNAVGDVSVSGMAYEDALKERFAIADASFAAKKRLGEARSNAIATLFEAAGIY